jgi:DnaJ family protein C protein 19
MLWLLLGAVVLFLLLGGMRAFERASVTSIKALFTWILALGGLSLALLLILTGRGGIALGALTLFGPLVYQRWQAARGRRIGGQAGGTGSGGARSGPGSGTGGRRGGAPRSGAMSRDEAYEVLGLHQGASESDIREAHRRLMRGAHPDAGGSDWLAARINQARDILLG